MNLEQLAKELGFHDGALDYPATVLEIPFDAELSEANRGRLADYLAAHYSYSASKVKQLRELPLNKAAPKVDLGAFLRRRQQEPDKAVQRLRKTRNCGDTAGLVLGGLEEIAKVQIARDMALESVVSALCQPPTDHEVWDITLHQHTFTLERHPQAASQWLIQAYQAGNATFNVQWWCSLDPKYGEPFCERQELQEVRDKWHRPSNDDVAVMAGLMQELFDAAPAKRQEAWVKLPCNKFDPFEKANELAFTIHRFTFKEEAEQGVSLKGLLHELDKLS